MSSLQTNEAVRALLDSWVENLAQVLESMTDQRPAVRWQAASGTTAALGLDSGSERLWSSYKLRCPQEAGIWISSPRQTWQQAGRLTLQATGLETSNPEEIKKTWSEILSQWLSAFARGLSSHLGREVTSQDTGENGSGENSPDGPQEWLLASLRFGEMNLPPVAVAFSPALVGLMTSAAESSGATAGRERDPGQPAGETMPPSRTLDLLLDVELPVSISFGKTQLPLKDLLKLTTGSIVELNRGVNEPVEVLVNRCLVARGEVVVVEGNYGVRIQQIASRQDRLRSIR
jgi:flagellar motor switch protein FliN